MIGAIGQAIPSEGEQIHLGHDAELEDAGWFPVEEVREALRSVRVGWAIRRGRTIRRVSWECHRGRRLRVS